VVADVRDAARAHSVTAINALVEIIENKKAPPAALVAAANSILDRGFGRPESKIDANITRRAVIRVPEVCRTSDEWVAKHCPSQSAKA